MPGNYSVSINDYDGQTGITGISFIELTAANFVTVLGQLGTFRSTLQALIRGVQVQAQVSIISRLAPGNTRADDDQAQRGNKWRVSYRDTTAFLDAPTNTIVNYGYQKPFDYEIPTANLSLRENNSDVIYTEAGGGVGLAAADIEAHAAAFEAVGRSPYGGECVVQFIEAVTRSGG